MIRLPSTGDDKATIPDRNHQFSGRQAGAIRDGAAATPGSKAI
jgi:hypothetical protein